MLKLEIKGVDIFNPLSDSKKIQAIIDSLTDVMGEEFRQEIEKRIKDTMFLFLPLGGNNSSVLNDVTQTLIFCGMNPEDESVKPVIEKLTQFEKLKSDIKNENNDAKRDYCFKRLKQTFPNAEDDSILSFLKDNQNVNIEDLFQLFKGLADKYFLGEEQDVTSVFSITTTLGMICKEFAPNEKDVLNIGKKLFCGSKIKNDAEKIDEDYKLKILQNNPFFLTAMKQIQSENLRQDALLLETLMNFLNEDINFNAFCTSFAKKSEGILPQKPALKTICVYDLAYNNSNKLTIHEIVHAITTQLLKSSILQFKTLKIKIGIKLTESKEIEKLDFKGDFRQIIKCQNKNAYKDLNKDNNYTGRLCNVFNEILTDYFALLASKKYKGKGVGDLGLDNGTPSVYSRTFPFMKDFIEKHRKLFAKILMSEDPSLTEKLFGEHRLMNLNLYTSDIFARIIENLGAYDKFAKLVESTMQEQQCEYRKAIKLVGEKYKEYSDFVASINDVLLYQKIINNQLELLEYVKKVSEEDQL